MAEINLETVLQAISELRTDLVGRIGKLEGGFDKLEGRIDRLEQGQTRLRVELSERIDRLQNGLDDLRQGYIIDWANVERTALIARGASDETRALSIQVTELTKLVRRLEAQIRDLRGAG
jgi:hypothetical protein